MSVADVALSSPTREDYATFSDHHIKSRLNYSSDELSSLTKFLTLAAGSVTPLKSLEPESIASLKFRTRKQKLSSDGKKIGVSSKQQHGGFSRENVEFITIFVRNFSGKGFKFSIEKFRSVAYLKKQILIKGKGHFVLENKEIICNGEKLKEDHKLIHDISHGKNKINLFVKNCAWNLKLQTSYANHEMDLPTFAQELINVTTEGLQNGHSPVLASEGMGGTYLMPDSSGRKYVSVFKPSDEEPMAENNPRGQPLSINGEGLRKGTRVGEGALREAAAYGLDHPRFGPRFLGRQEKGFSGVPVSLMVQCSHEGFNNTNGYDGSIKNMKMGSLQKFVRNCGSCEDFGPSDFPVEEVHKISVLDIRLANTDRHAGNILMSYEDDGSIVLIPIDHGYCLPDNFEDCTFEWLNWPQSRTPFSPDTIDYINSLDAEDDIKQIALFGWDLSPSCARTFRISTMLLQKGARRGFTPYIIGNFMSRQILNKESAIEEIIREAQDSLFPCTSIDSLMEIVSKIMDSRLDKLMK